MYLYRATKDPLLLEMGMQIVDSIEKNAKTECGYATVIITSQTALHFIFTLFYHQNEGTIVKASDPKDLVQVLVT